MKYIQNSLIVLSLLAVSARAKDLLPRVPTDKKLHYSVSFGLQYGLSDLYESTGMDRPWLWAAATALALGAVKEIAIDSKGDRDDMIANMAGVGSAVLLHYAVRW